ncbi:MAG: efflux RND transporter periplasmic adaptor subunit [Chlorobi bacterium]|nr:efflux RND transporter periplasmic adaptor subunit [Chlorobiota bacterium]
MKQNLIIIIALLFLASCGSTTVKDEATRHQELQQYKQELHELEQKISALEKELSANVEEEIINVKVEKIESRLFEHFIEVNGNVEADLDVDLSPESAGIIEEVLAKEGMDVKKGQVLGRLNTDALQRSLDELKIQLELAVTTFERQKNLWSHNIGSEMQYLQAKTNKESLEKRIEGIQAQIDMAIIKSPINGEIDVVYQEKGQIGSPQTPFVKVLNISQVKIYADVSETYLTKIKKGDKVTVFFPALDREVEASIYRMGNTIDPYNRTFRVRVNLNNRDRMIKPNLVSVLKIRDYTAENAVVVPSLLIKKDFKGDFTYIVDSSGGKNKAKKVYVKPGVSNNNITEIVDGLSAGMQIITEGYTQIVDGSIIQF